MVARALRSPHEELNNRHPNRAIIISTTSRFRLFLTMNRMDRLLGIVTQLQSRKFIPAEKIAARFHISIRTVYRDINALVELGIPISFEQGRGYFVVQGYFLPPVSFSNEEASALLLSQTLVYGFADKSTQKHYSAALNKIKAVLRDPQKEKIEAMEENIRIQMHPNLMLNVEYLSLLQHAIASKMIVMLQYRSSKEEVTEREVEPVGLIFYAFSWHLIAFCHRRNDYRDFKISRITQVSDTRMPFRRPVHIGISEYMKTLPVNY